jgi:hypothetical protein
MVYDIVPTFWGISEVPNKQPGEDAEVVKIDTIVPEPQVRLPSGTQVLSA